jgi:hypothetical protein
MTMEAKIDVPQFTKDTTNVSFSGDDFLPGSE